MRLAQTLIVIGLVLSWAAPARPAWYDSNYRYKQRLTIDHNRIFSGPHAEFPVLVTEANVDPAFFSHVAKSTPSNIDIIFTNGAEDALLNREVVIFNSTGHKLQAWVNIPSLPGDVDTEVCMYYGYAGANVPNQAATWNSGYAGVWHLAETGGATAADSTANNYAGDFAGTLPQSAAGVFGTCQTLNSAVYDHVDLGPEGDTPQLDISGANSMMVEAWVYFSSLTAGTAQSIVTKGLHQYMLEKSAVGNKLAFSVYDGGTYHNATSNADVATGTWYHVAGRYISSNSQVALFINGTGQSCQPLTSGINNSSYSVQFGSNHEASPPRYLNGRIQEVRIHRTARGYSWFQTGYSNQSNPAAFYTGVGSEEILPTPTFTVTRTVTRTATRTATPTVSPTVTISPTLSPTATPSPSPPPTPTITPTPPPTSTPQPVAAGEVIVYPSPAKDDALWFYYTAVEPCRVRIEIFNVAGEKVETLCDSLDAAGPRRTRWDIRRVAPGVYFYRLRLEGVRETTDPALRKLVIIKK